MFNGMATGQPFHLGANTGGQMMQPNAMSPLSAFVPKQGAQTMPFNTGLNGGLASPAATSTVDTEYHKAMTEASIGFMRGYVFPSICAGIKTDFNIDVTVDHLSKYTKAPRAPGNLGVQTASFGGAIGQPAAATRPKQKIPNPKLPVDTTRGCTYRGRGQNKDQCGKPVAMGYDHCNDCLTKVTVRKEYEKRGINIPTNQIGGINQLQPQLGFGAVQLTNMAKPAAAINPGFGMQQFMPKPAANVFANQQVQAVGTVLNRIAGLQPGMELYEEPNHHIIVHVLNGVKKVVGYRTQNNSIADITDAHRQLIRQQMQDLVVDDAVPQQQQPQQFQQQQPQQFQAQQQQPQQFQVQQQQFQAQQQQPQQFQGQQQPQQFQPQQVHVQQPVFNNQLHAPAPAPVQTVPLQHMVNTSQPASGLANAVTQASAATSNQQDRLDGGSVQQPDQDEQVGEDQPVLEPQVQAPAQHQVQAPIQPQVQANQVSAHPMPQPVALKPVPVMVQTPAVQDLSNKLRAMSVNK